jgi:hypothetical protein
MANFSKSRPYFAKPFQAFLWNSLAVLWDFKDLQVRKPHFAFLQIFGPFGITSWVVGDGPSRFLIS